MTALIGLAILALAPIGVHLARNVYADDCASALSMGICAPSSTPHTQPTTHRALTATPSPTAGSPNMCAP